MSSDIEEEKLRLKQSQFLDHINRELRATDMLDVYFEKKDKEWDIAVYCALIPNTQIESSLKNPSWDLYHGSGLPETIEYVQGGNKQVEYLRFGNDDSIEPLVIDRYFDGMQEDYQELSEEFRLFHRLYHDRKSDKFIKFDNMGNEHVVATVEPHRIQIRVKEIMQFLAVKEMHLAIMFDSVAKSSITLLDLGLEEGLSMQKTEDMLVFSLAYSNYMLTSNNSSFSNLLGKRLIPPLLKEKSGFFGFGEEKPKTYVDFIIDVDEAGEDVLHTSNPDLLDNAFGANPEAPQYLTPVYFNRTVLDKYYRHSSKYSVEDGYLRCSGLWGIRIDNHQEDQIMVWLGDLGRDLSYQEQLHWRSHNIQPNGKISETTYKRQILGQPADSTLPEHVFRQQYKVLTEICNEYLGWQLLLPLNDDDAHHFQNIRIPSTDEQCDFDELVLSLTKILIDSLNEGQLKKLIPNDQLKDIIGSIARFEAALEASGVNDATDHISFLRKLQNLRSSSSAHRKGKTYSKIASEFGVGSQNLRAVYSKILLRAIVFLNYLINLVQNNRLVDASINNLEDS
jgi:hypothetical protein